MLVRIPPKYSVSEIVGYLKGKSSLMTFEKHANLKYKYGNRHFWCRGYYVDTVGNQSKPAIPFWGCAGVREHWISPFRGSCECGAVGRLLISKEQYYKVLLIHIENYRAFLKGEDEVVNSKDLYQTLNTRYVYLPYLQELVKQENLQHSFSCFELQKEIDCALQIFLWMMSFGKWVHIF